MSNRKLNSYDVLAWWGKVLNSCNTEDQFKNALNIWPKVIDLTPCVGDAWIEVVDAAKCRLRRIVPPLNRLHTSHGIIINYPATSKELIRHVFGRCQAQVKQ